MLSPHRGGKESEAAGKKQGKTGKSHSEREPRGGGDKTGHQQSTSHQQEAPSDGLELSNEGQGEPEDDGLGNNETNYHFDWRNDGSANDHATGTGASQWSAWNGEWDVQYSLKGEGPEPGNPPSSVSHASKPPSKGKQHEPRQRHIEKHTEAPPEEPSSYDQSAGASASPNVVPHGYYGEPYQYDGQLLDQFSQVSLYGDPTTQDDYVPALGYEGGSGDYDALYRHGGQQAEPPVREEPESKYDVSLHFKMKLKEKWKDARGMFDTGNRAGSLILCDTVFSLGYRHEDIDFSRMMALEVVGGHRTDTVGVIKLAYCYSKGSETLEGDFHILMKVIKDYDVLIAPPDQPRYPGEVPPVAATIGAKRELTGEEKTEWKKKVLKAEKRAQKAQEEKDKRKEAERAKKKEADKKKHHK